MTIELLERLEGTIIKNALEYKKKMRRRFLERGLDAEAKAVKDSTAGYIQALRDCDVITESEREALIDYYIRRFNR